MFTAYNSAWRTTPEAAPSQALYTYAEEYDGARSGTIPAQSVWGHTGRQC